MPSRPDLAKTPVRRRKSIIQKWRQIRRIQKKALEGISPASFRTEFLPLIRKFVEDESIATRTRDPFNDAVREQARQGVEWARHDMGDKIHQLALSRAFNMAMVFPRSEREAVRIKMNQVWHMTNRPVEKQVFDYLKEKIGFRYKMFFNSYLRSINWYTLLVNSYIEKERRKILR